MSLRNLFLLIVVVNVLAGCSEARYMLRYEQPPEDHIWPQPPEKPRYRFAGQLTGERNFEKVEDGGAGAAIMDFLKAVVGLGAGSDVERNLLRPQTGVVDQQGRVLVTDAGRAAVFVFDKQQGKLLIWRDATEDFSFVSPVGIGIAANGDVLVADSELKRVVRLDSVTGQPKGEFGFSELERPTGLAVGDKGQVFVADTAEHNIKVYDDKGVLTQIIGKVGEAAGQLNAPTHLSFRDGTLYVTDTFNARVQLIDEQGNFIKSLGERGLYMGNLVRPKGVTTDSDKRIYIVESFHDYLLIYDQDGRFLLPIGGSGSGVGQFYLPAGAWSDDQDRIYVADMYNGRIAIFDYIK